jgi:hypothetical protein
VLLKHHCRVFRTKVQIGLKARVIYLAIELLLGEP